MRLGWRMGVVGGLLGICVHGVWANNIAVENVSLRNHNPGSKTVDVVFNLAWENSWRGTDNWDAAWVFVKFRAPGSNQWQHAQLSSVSGDHTPAANATIDAVPDGKGVFLYRSAGYTGSVSYARTLIKWNYGSNGYDFAKGASLTVAVHAIEMVYIPQGGFYLGSGGAENNPFYKYTDGSQSTQTYWVASESEIAIGLTNGFLCYPTNNPGVTRPGDQTGVLSNSFPKGFNAFYCMKYEVSQGQYADFLNSLTNDTARFPNQNGNNRHTIGGAMGNRTVGAPDRACNYIRWSDVMAYADWAALRPMTELEYEKACRGPIAPVANAYAWGSTTVTRQTNHAGAADGSGLETALPTNANANYNNGIPAPQGPVRVGIFAQANSSREAAGASYWGVMELSGNLYERVVNVGHSAGRAFQGTLGDGVLDASGNATGNADWPTGNGTGWRGGSWAWDTTWMRTSDRNNIVYNDGNADNRAGIRVVRQAP